MGFFSRFIDPENQSLRLELSQAKVERDWYRDRCDELGALVRKREAAMSAEIKRNRLREDLLNNQIIELGGGRPLPARIQVEQPVEESQMLAETDEILLRTRAREILMQKHPGGEFTDEDLEQALDTMREDPNYWLSN